MKLKNRIVEQVVTGQATKNRETIGAALPLKTWLSNAVPSVKVIWQMKWAGLMLMPQRLILAVMEDVTISGKKAWKIAGKELCVKVDLLMNHSDGTLSACLVRGGCRHVDKSAFGSLRRSLDGLRGP